MSFIYTTEYRLGRRGRINRSYTGIQALIAIAFDLAPAIQLRGHGARTVGVPGLRFDRLPVHFRPDEPAVQSGPGRLPSVHRSSGY